MLIALQRVRALAALLLVAGLLSACGSGDTFEEFQSAFTSGASCERLFEIRNEMDPDDPRQSEMNSMLRSVECFSTTSERQSSIAPVGDPSGTPASANYVSNYRISFGQCAHDREQLFAEAGTRDPRAASQWLSEVMVAGDGRDGSRDGCLDALTDRPNRYPS